MDSWTSNKLEAINVAIKGGRTNGHSVLCPGHAMRYFVTINTLNDDDGDDGDERTTARRSTQGHEFSRQAHTHKHTRTHTGDNW